MHVGSYDNAILQRLTESDLALLLPLMRRVALRRKQKLQFGHRKINAVTFLEDGVAAVLAVAPSQEIHSEVALVGREGMTGLPLICGDDTSAFEIVMQTDGRGQQVSADGFCRALDASPTLRSSLLSYYNLFSIECAETALANARGRLDERLARLLLRSQDRLGKSMVCVTHEALASMLGVRRSGVSTTLKTFEREGLVTTFRKAIRIDKRGELQTRAREFYASVNGTPAVREPPARQPAATERL